MTERIESEFNPCDVCEYTHCNNCILHELAMKFVKQSAEDVVDRHSFDMVSQKYAQIQDKLIRGEFVPVVYGRWIEHKNYHHGHYIDSVYECSVCERIEPLISDYCPNCGARMDGE